MLRRNTISATGLVFLVLVLLPGNVAGDGPGVSISGAQGRFQLNPTWGKVSVPGLGYFLGRAQPFGAAQSPSFSLGVDLPEWLKRVDIAAQIGDGSPRFYLETVQPLYQDHEQIHTVFIQPRISIKDGHGLYNLGVGYRELLFNEQLLAGINTFYDYTDNHDHQRLGVGLELLSRYVELRGNGYFPVTGSRKIKEDTEKKTFERALTGADIEAGGPLPYLPFLKLYGGYAFYDYHKDINSHIGKIRAEVSLTRFLRLDAQTWNDNKAPWKYRIGLVLTMNTDRPTELLTTPSVEPYPQKDMRHMVLFRVVREHEIKVEQYSKDKATGATIAIRRGT